MQLPMILAGPIIRRVEEKSAYLWLATSKPVQVSATVYVSKNTNKNITTESLVPIGESSPMGDGSVTECIGENLHVTLLRLNPSEEKFPLDRILYYDLIVKDEKEKIHDLGELAYEDSPLPSFYIPSTLKVVLHGS